MILVAHINKQIQRGQALVKGHTASWSVIELGLASMSNTISTMICGIINGGGASWVSCPLKRKKWKMSPNNWGKISA